MQRALILQRGLLACGFLASLLYVVTDIIGALHYPGYDYAAQAISEMSATGAPTTKLLTPYYQTFSVLFLAFSVGVWLSGRSRRPLRLSAAFLFGVVVVGTGFSIYPMNMRGVERTFRVPLRGGTPPTYGMAHPFSTASGMMPVLEKERSGPMSIVILGVDLGKNSCSVVGVDEAGAVVVRRSLRRSALFDYVSKLPPCVIAMEACCGAHHLGRLFAAKEHEVRLMSPEYVRPYVKAQKNDDRDAEGIAEAASRPTMRFVDLKSQEQLDIQTLHRARSRLVAERTNLINQLRAILLERGVIFPVGRRKLELGVDALLVDGDGTLSPRIRRLIVDLRAEWNELDKKIEALNGEFVEMARRDASMRRLTSIPGVGVLNATALVAAIGDGSGFAKARDLGAWLGLVPRQHTTGGKPRLLGISKRGNTYLRTLLIHGARAALPSLSHSDTLLGRWLKAMIDRGVHRNAVVVALANKLARIAWAALRKETTFERSYPVAV